MNYTQILPVKRVGTSPEPQTNLPDGTEGRSIGGALKFFVGAILPFIVTGFLVKAYSMNASFAFENQRYEEKITVHSDDNVTFEWTLEIPKDYPRIVQIDIGSSWNYIALAGGEHTVNIGGHQNDWSTRLNITQWNISETHEIGYYEPSNQTIFFRLENASYENVTLWVYFDWQGSLGSKFSWWAWRLIDLTAVVACIGSLGIATRFNNTAFGKGLATGLLLSGGVALVIFVVGSILGGLANCAVAC